MPRRARSSGHAATPRTPEDVVHLLDQLTDADYHRFMTVMYRRLMLPGAGRSPGVGTAFALLVEAHGRVLQIEREYFQTVGKLSVRLSTAIRAAEAESRRRASTGKPADPKTREWHDLAEHLKGEGFTHAGIAKELFGRIGKKVDADSIRDILKDRRAVRRKVSSWIESEHLRIVAAYESYAPRTAEYLRSHLPKIKVAIEAEGPRPGRAESERDLAALGDRLAEAESPDRTDPFLENLAERWRQLGTDCCLIGVPPGVEVPPPPPGDELIPPGG